MSSRYQCALQVGMLALGLAGWASAGDVAPTPPSGSTGELIHPSTQESASPRFDPVDTYEQRTVRGWQVLVNRKLVSDQPDLAKQTMELLDFQLFQITRVVPATALAKLRTIHIWVEKSDPLFPCMCYHSSRDWVASHGLNPEKTHGVELANPKNFLTWTIAQPWMVLHELSHGYHDQFLSDGFDNAKVLAAYNAASHDHLYDAVLRYGGTTERAYAMTNQMEYFAECSEAYFGTNDFYPFMRTEFEKHDQKGFATLKELWGE